MSDNTQNNQSTVFGRLVRAVSTMSSLTMLSRIFGLAREVAVNAFIGPGAVTDAFNLALRLPNMFRQMFAEGAFSASFVPLFTKIQDEQGQRAARDFASAVASVILLVFGTLTVLAVLFMKPLLGLIPNMPQMFDLAVLYARITAIYLLCMILTALVTGVLNTKQHFAAGAIAPIFFNLCMIVGLFVAMELMGVTKAMGGLTLAICVATAGVLQVIFVWLVCACKYRFVIYVPVPKLSREVVQLGRLMAPGLLAAGGLQLNTLIGTILALRETGWLSLLNTAERLYQLPVGLIAVAFGVAALPQLSAFFAKGERDKAIQTINIGVELALFIAVPATLALVAMPEVIVELLFERGEFSHAHTMQVAQLIAIFAFALPALSLQRVFNASFHSRKKMRPPMYMTLLGVVLNIVAAVCLMPILGLLAIPTAIVLSAWVQVLCLTIWVMRDGLWQPDRHSIWRFVGIIVSALAMSVALWTIKPVLMAWAGGSTLTLLMVTAVMIAGGLASYVGSALVLRALNPDIRAMMVRR